MPFIFALYLIQMILCVAFIIATPIIIYLKLKERDKEREEERKKDYSDY